MNENAMVPYVTAEWTRERIELVKSVFAKGTTDDEFKLFLSVCQKTGLSPEARQIHAVKRWDSKLEREVMTIQTGIDGYRVVAQRSGEYEGQTGPQWCGKDGIWSDIWLGDEQPFAARVGVWRKAFREPAWGIARYSAYVQTFKDKKTGSFAPTQFWRKMGAEQLAKCAEALALRKAYPQELSGIYTNEEMAQASEHEAPQVVKTDVEILANPSLDVEEKPLAQVLDEAKVKSLGAVETYAPEAVERSDRIALTEAQQRIAAREEAVAAVDKSLPLKEQLVQIEEHVRATVAKEKRDACKLCGSPLGDYTSEKGPYRQCIKAHKDRAAAIKMGIEGDALKAISRGHTFESKKVADLSDQLNQALAE